MNAYVLGAVVQRDLSIGLEVREATSKDSMEAMLIKQYTCSRYEEADCLLKEALGQILRRGAMRPALKDVILSDAKPRGVFAVNLVYERDETLSKILRKNDRVKPTSPGMSKYVLESVIREHSHRNMQVYTAYDTKASISVIASIFEPCLSLNKMNKVIRKGFIEASAAHKNRVKIVDIWMLQNWQVGFAFERLNMDVKRDIQQRKVQQHPYSEQELLFFLFQITSALISSKTRGIASTYINLENIFLSDECNFKLGAITQTAQNSAQTQLLQSEKQQANKEGGHLCFLKSEKYPCVQRRRKGGDTFASDVYSLGLTVLQMASLSDCPESLFISDELQHALVALSSSTKYKENIVSMIREMTSNDFEQRPTAEKIFAKVVSLLELHESQDSTIREFFETAITEMEQSIIIENFTSLQDPYELAGAYLAMSRIKTKENKQEEGIEWAKRALRQADILSMNRDCIQASCYHDLGNLYLEIGNIEEAEKCYLSCLNIRTLILPESHPDLAECYSNLGNVYSELKNIDEAEKNYLQCLCILQNIFFHDHPSLALFYHNFGVFYSNFGEMEKAENNYLKSVDILETDFPKNHPVCAECYNSLGILYCEKGNMNEAEKYFLKHLSILQQIASKNHPDIAMLYSNLGILYHEMGNIDAAVKYFLQSINTLRLVLPENSTKLASYYHDLGVLYLKQGDMREAKKYCLKCLNIRKQIFPEEHPQLASCYNTIGVIYKQKGKLGEAEKCYLKCIEKVRQGLSGAQPGLAESYNNLGILCYERGNIEEAEKNFVESLHIIQEGFSDNHPNFALCYNNLGVLCKHQDDMEEAETYYMKCLSTLRQIFPEDHAAIAECYNNLGIFYEDLGDMDEAVKYYLKCVGIRERIFPEAHPDLAAGYNILGDLHLDQCKLEEAEKYYLKNLEILKRTLPEDHPSLASCYHKLETLYSELNSTEEAEKYYLMRIDIRKQIFSEDHPNLVTCTENLELPNSTQS